MLNPPIFSKEEERHLACEVSLKYMKENLEFRAEIKKAIWGDEKGMNLPYLSDEDYKEVIKDLLFNEYVDEEKFENLKEAINNRLKEANYDPRPYLRQRRFSRIRENESINE